MSGEVLQPLTYYGGPIQGEVVMAGLVRFIQDTFSTDVSPLLHIGHDPGTVTFGWWQGEELVANISLFPRLLCVQGLETAAFGIQSVGVRPAHRGKGLFSDLIQKALAHADAILCPIVFTTDKPDLFRPYGFQWVPEHAFRARVRSALELPRCRPLALHHAADIELIKACFAKRAATSLVASTRDHPSAFFLKAMGNTGIEVLHVPELEAIVALQGRSSTEMAVLEVIAASIPSVQDIVSAVGYSGTQVILHLTPDQLALESDAIPSPYRTPLLARKMHVQQEVPIMLSRMRV